MTDTAVTLPAAPLAGWSPPQGPLRTPGPALTEGLAAAAPALRTILARVLLRRHKPKRSPAGPFGRPSRPLVGIMPAGRLETDPAASSDWTLNPTWDSRADPNASRHRTALGFDLCAALALLDGIPPATAALAVLEAASGQRPAARCRGLGRDHGRADGLLCAFRPQGGLGVTKPKPAPAGLARGAAIIGGAPDASVMAAPAAGSPRAGKGASVAQSKPKKEKAAQGAKERRPRASDFDATGWLGANGTSFVNRRGEAFLTIKIGAHLRTVPVASDAARYAVSKACVEATGKPLSPSECDKALAIVAGDALASGSIRDEAFRVAWDGDAVCIDRGGPGFDMIRVTKDGWSIEPIGALPFVRRPSMGELPMPEPEGNLGDLRAFMNVETEADFTLIMAWLVTALRPEGPYAFLNLGGEQGSSKSTLAKLLRGLIDPNAVPLRNQPKDIDDLRAAATNNWVLSFDNTSRLEQWQSDAHCVLATGGGFAGRALYRDSDEALFWGMRPQVSNGIPNILQAPDLMQRAYSVRLRRIEDHERLTETAFWRRWRAFEPYALGLLLDGVSAALRNYDAVEAAGHRLPRLADAAVWSIAAETGLGLEPGAFLRAVAENEAFAVAESFSSDPVAMGIAALVPEIGNTWSGTPGRLLDILTEAAPEAVRKSLAWPRVPQGLTTRIERISPVLRLRGINIVRSRGEQRNVFIQRTKRSEEASQP